MDRSTNPSTRKSCQHCGSSFTKSSYYDHLPCGKSSSHGGKDNVISRVGDKFYCQHCNKGTVSKGTFYGHQALYGDSACEYASQSKELELDLDCDSENDGVIPCWDDEDRLFFSEDNDSSDDNGDDEVVSQEASADENESSVQPRQQIQGDTSLKDTQCFEYSDEIEEDEGACGECKETGNDIAQNLGHCCYFSFCGSQCSKLQIGP